MADFSFLSPSPSLPPVVQPLEEITPKPPMHPHNLPPLIILDDSSINCTHQNSSTQCYPEYSCLMESPSTLSPHFHIHSASSNSDSDMLNPPSSAVSSESNSAAVSESDLPSAVASDSDLLFPPIPSKSGSKKQAGIHQFFKTLSKHEVQAMQAKRKRVDFDEEEADRTERRKKEEEQRQKKLVF